MFNWQCLSGDRQEMETSKTLKLFSLKKYVFAIGIKVKEI